MFGVALPKSGGAVAGGTATDPLRVDPTGTTVQPVSGPLTDTQLRATPVPVSGPLTDTQLRASVVPVGDGGGSLTVDGSVSLAAAIPAGNNNIGDVDVVTLPAGTMAGVTAKTADFDTGAGTDTVPMVGMALPKSGGAVAGGTSTDPIRVDPTGTTAQPITDNGGSLTVDGTVATTAADNSNVAIGATTDAAVTTNTTGTLSAKLRGLVAILADVWDSTNHFLKTQLAAGENHVGAVGGHTRLVEDGLTRLADTTPYSVGDIVATHATGASIYILTFSVARVAAGSLAVVGLRLRKTTSTTTNASFRVHLYHGSPTASNGDNGTWLTNNQGVYLGWFDVTTDKVFTEGALGISTDPPLYAKLPSTQNIFGVIEARAPYIPGSNESFYVQLQIVQD
jgi:hypothetical protein